MVYDSIYPSLLIILVYITFVRLVTHSSILSGVWMCDDDVILTWDADLMYLARLNLNLWTLAWSSLVHIMTNYGVIHRTLKILQMRLTTSAEPQINESLFRELKDLKFW